MVYSSFWLSFSTFKAESIAFLATWRKYIVLLFSGYCFDYSFKGGLVAFLLYFAFFLGVSGIYALFPWFSGVLGRSSVSVLELFSAKLSNGFGDILSSLVARNKAFPLDTDFITSFQDHLRTLDTVYRLLTNRSAFLA